VSREKKKKREKEGMKVKRIVRLATKLRKEILLITPSKPNKRRTMTGRDEGKQEKGVTGTTRSAALAEKNSIWG